MAGTQVAGLDATLPSAPDSQVRDDYATARTGAANPDPMKALQQLAAPATPAPASPAVAAPGGGDRVSDQTLSSLVTGAPPNVPIGRRIVNGAKAVATDIAGGATEAHKQIVGGVLDYANNLMKFADTAVKFAEDKGLPNVYFQLFDGSGKWDPGVMTTEQFRKAQAEGKADVFQVPTTSAPETVTGNVLRTATSFIIGRGNIARGGGAAANIGADIVSGATALDPKEQRISNVVDSIYPNFMTAFLKAKPEDEGTMLSHLKSGLEMGGLGLAVQGIIGAIKATKSAITGMGGAGSEAAPAAAEGAGASSAADVAPMMGGAPEPALAGAGAGSGVRTPAQQAMADMKSDLPWEGKPVQSAVLPESSMPGGSAGVAAPPDAPALRSLRENGWPAPDSGHPLAPAAEDVKTVEVSPQLKENFDKFMAQERGEIATPLEANAKPLAEQRSADFSATGESPVKVNLNMINGPDDLKDAIARVSSQIPAQAIRRNEAVVDAAQSVGMSAEDFMARVGPLSDQEVVAVRMIANDIARQSLDYFKAAALPGATEETKASALAAYAKVHDMLGYIEQAKVQSGRGVQAWGIKVAGMNVPYADAVKRIAEVTGGPDSEAFFSRMAALDTPQQVAGAANAAAKMTSQEWFMYGWYNSLLSYRTVVKKAVSDAGMASWNLATRYAAEKFGSGAVVDGETAALLQGYTGGFTDALKVARQGLREGKSKFFSDVATLDAFDRAGNLGEGALPEIPMTNPTWAARDYLRAALPTSWIGAFDDFAKTANYLAEKHSLAYRHAAGKGLVGDELEQAVKTLENNPPTWLHKQAVNNALTNTFQDPLTGIFATIRDGADQLSMPLPHTQFELPVGRILMPFVKVPVNIMRWSYNNSPLPLISQSNRIAAELAQGGATRDIALAKIGMGTALSTSFAGLALSGVMTGKGPSDPQLQRAWQAAGNEPHSIKLPGMDKAYGYNMVEPFGLMAGAIADTFDVMRFAKEEDAGQAATSLIFGAGQALMSKTYLEGVADFFKALESPEKEAGYWERHLASSALTPNAIADFRKVFDPWARQHYSLLQDIEARLPYVSQNLPPQRTLWGDAVPLKDGYIPLLTGTGAARMLSPIPVGPMLATEPIDKWIFDHRMDFPGGPSNRLGISKPALVQSFSAGPNVSAQVELTPEQHDRLQVLAGNELKDPQTGMGAKDTLNALLDDKHPSASMQRQWDNASDAEKALVVQTVVNKFRSAAKKQLIQEFPDLEDVLRAGWQARAEQLQGAH